MNEFAATTVVTGRPVFDGQRAARARKGIVLGDFGQGWVIVWWYGMGAATLVEGAATVCIMRRDELTRVGDIFDMGARQARTLAKGLYNFRDGQSVGRSLTRHAARMAQLGAQYPTA